MNSLLQSAVFRRLTLNSLWLLIGRAASQGLLLVFTMLVARYLGQGGLGQIAFITAVIFLGNVFSTFGMDTLLIREIATVRRANASLTAALTIQLLLALLFILTLLLAAAWLPRQTPQTLSALKLYSLSLLPLAFFTAYSAVLRAYERMDLFLLLNLVTAVFQTAGTYLILSGGGGLMALVWLLLATQMVGAITAVLLCHHSLPFSHHWTLSLPILRRTFRSGRSLALLMVLAILYQRLGIFALSFLAGEAATGWFSAAARLVEAFKMLPYALFGALFPVMARTAARPSDQPRPGLYNHLFLLLLFCMLLVATAATATADLLIPFLYGPTYTLSATALRILIWSLIPFTVTLKLSFELVSSGQENVALRAMLLTVAVAAALFFFLVQKWGLIGACWATVSSETVQAMILIFYQRGSTDKPRLQ